MTMQRALYEATIALPRERRDRLEATHAVPSKVTRIPDSTKVQ